MIAQGHVFVVRGRLEEISCDARIVPTGKNFSVGPWEPVLGKNPTRHKPPLWKHGAVSRSIVDPALWFVDVGITSGDSDLWQFEQATKVLGEVACSGMSASRGRVLPLVCLPLLGIGRGGASHKIGDQIVGMLKSAESVAKKYPIDIAFVINDHAIYGAVQGRRRELARDGERSPLDDHAIQLAQASAQGELALFLGAGISIPAGLPTWASLIENLKEGLALPDDPSDLDALDEAELIESEIRKSGVNSLTLEERIKNAIGTPEAPALSHALLASLGCEAALTTNYDDLYERALAATGAGAHRVLPKEFPERGEPWILKMHGDLAVPGSIVLTRGSFVGYDTHSRPAGSIFQSMLLTKHMLILGVSMTDDNILRLIHEAQTYRQKESTEQSKLGTLVDVSGHQSRRLLWEQSLHWLSMPGETHEERARELEIFLDRVGMHASSDRSWVLDERFAGLFTLDHQRIVDGIRALLGQWDDTEDSGPDATAYFRDLGFRN